MSRRASIAATLGPLLLALSIASSCTWRNRGLLYEVSREGSSFTYGAPVVSGFGITDAVQECATGESEQDLLASWRRLAFTPVFSDAIQQAKLTLCTDADQNRRIVIGAPSEILSDGTDVGGCLLSFVYEYRQLGRYTLVAGACENGDDAVLEGEWSGGTVGWSRALGTGTDLGNSSSLSFLTGFDGGWNGLRLSAALTYFDGEDRSGLAFCEKIGLAWTCNSLFLATDFGAAELAAPKLGLGCVGDTRPDEGCAAPAAEFASFYSTNMQFGLPDTLRYAWVSPTPGSATTVIGVGDPAPGLPGETIDSFGDFGSLTGHAAGNSMGAFSANTSPSSKSAIWKYGLLSFGAPVFTSGDVIPDTVDAATTVGSPSFERDRLSFVAQSAPGRLVFVAETDDLEGLPTPVGIARTGIDMWGERELTGLQASHQVRNGRLAVLGFNLSSAMAGSEVGIGVQDLERVEVVRGAQATLYGSHSTLGVVPIVTSPDFDVRGPHGTGIDFQSSTFDRLGRLWLGTGSGDLYEFDLVDDLPLFRGATGASALYGLAFDYDQDMLYGIDATQLFRIDTSTYGATPIGMLRDPLDQPILGIRGLGYAEGELVGAALDGNFYQIDRSSGVGTLAASVVGLPSDLQSFGSDRDGRYFGGLSDGRIVEFIDYDFVHTDSLTAAAAGLAAEPETFGFNVVGDPQQGPAAGLAVAVPEPDPRLLALAALWALSALARRRPTRR